MNVALIIGGGKGERTGIKVPKQFYTIFDKPVIVYTLEAFQKHPDIDAIAVVCLEGWSQILDSYAKQYRINKLQWTFIGGETGQASIRNGVYGLKGDLSPEDIIIVHDAVRPLVTHDIISECIVTCKKYGSAVTSIRCAEAILKSDNGIISDESIPREFLYRTQTPQAFPLSLLLWAHEQAEKRGIVNSVASCTLMAELGQPIYLCNGSEKNIKITTIEDIEIVKALIKIENER